MPDSAPSMTPDSTSAQTLMAGQQQGDEDPTISCVCCHLDVPLTTNSEISSLCNECLFGDCDEGDLAGELLTNKMESAGYDRWEP